ncbi:LCP family protein [Brevibacillus fluminis]|nr:LCP family protein [Brevibacillus fluminis]
MKPIREWKKRTKWIVGSSTFLLLFLFGMIGYTAWQLYDTAKAMYQPVERLPSLPRQEALAQEKEQAVDEEQSVVDQRDNAASGSSATPQAATKKEPIQTTAFLLLGVDHDSAATDTGRTDVIMLAILNGKSGKLTLTSIPRDTYVQIAGKNHKDKINAAFHSGVETTIATVENFTGVIVDHYVLFNFDGFVKAIDSMGGIQLDVDANAAVELKVQAGLQHLAGAPALEYARFRSDARGDFGRNERQQKVMKAVLEESKGLRSPDKIKQILDTVGKDVRTDLTFSQMVTFAAHLDDFSADNVDQIVYSASTARFGPQNLSYVLIDDTERKRVTNLLKATIGAAK